MDVLSPIELILDASLARAAEGAPPGLADAVRSAVFPGGMRVRPRLCLAVAEASGAADLTLAAGIGAAIELLHCASLVHDDLPCFDDAALRRGQPSVHARCGPALAVLAGDGLIVLAAETLVRAASEHAALAPLLLMFTRAAGMTQGLVAGQAWETEQVVPLGPYHRAKTASLFVLAATAGALAAGAAPAPWSALGERLGEAYQIADDVRDALLDGAELGKPNGRDVALGRPSAMRQFGGRGALGRMETLVQGALAAIPPCRNPGLLRDLIVAEMGRLLPRDLAARAAA